MTCGEELWCAINDDHIRFESRHLGDPVIIVMHLQQLFGYHWPNTTTTHFLRWQAAVSAEILKQYEEQTL